MIRVEINESTNKVSLTMEGNLGVIYQELALAVLKIAEQKDLEMTTDDVIDMIKEQIEEE